MASRKRRKGSGIGRTAVWAAVAFALLFLVSLGLRYRERLTGLSWSSLRDAPTETPESNRGSRRQAASPTIVESEEDGLRLQILNATGVNRLALDTGDRLRHWGVDTLDRGNAPAWPFPETMLLVRAEQPGRLAVVENLAARLGGVPVLMQRREDLVLDATLLLGHDWEDYQWPDP